MTSGNLFFKLLKEDFKRRTWAIALTFLTCFFTLPIGLALAMENAANTDYYVYNNYRPFIQSSAMPDALFQEQLLGLKTKVVLSQASFGNGIVVFFMIVAAVVIGVSSFSYLHNKKKVDFYHSIPVRREIIYGAQFLGGILIVGLSYLISLLMTLFVALSYGVPAGSVLGAMAGGWALNMLYFMLMYAVVAVAMMMTGNLVVGILATGIFFFFIPIVMLLLAGYCETFFVTTARYMWSSEESPFMWGVKYLSPFSVYVNALGWGTRGIGKHVPELVCTVLSFLALTLLGLQLYRRRPSEAAGKAMAFKRTMAPIRMLIVMGSGLAGGMFFWSLQSRLRWGLFGVVVSIILAHCVIEIIYHFDFKKLFGCRVQLGICLAAGVLLFLSFRYDWYGYDSYIPQTDRIVSASLDINLDSCWLEHRELTADEDGNLEMRYRQAYEDIEDDMALTDLDLVMPIVEAGRKQTLKNREGYLGGAKTSVTTAQRDRAVTYIGGADGPTSVFVAGSTAGGEIEPPAQEYYTNVTVCYRLANGRQVKRSYNMYLSDVLDTYVELYDGKEYKEGLYNILNGSPDQYSAVFYKEAGGIAFAGDEGSAVSELLKAYQEDFKAMPARTRMKEAPVGSICFVTRDSETYLDQGAGDSRYNMVRGSAGSGYVYKSRMDGYRLEDLNQSWPVYPSFTNTIRLLGRQGVEPGTLFSAGNVEEIRINVQNLIFGEDSYGELPQGEDLEKLQKVNPYYKDEGYVLITGQEDIARLMEAMMEEEYYIMDQFRQTTSGAAYCEVKLEGGVTVSGLILKDRLTPDILKLFEGLPVEQLAPEA